MFDRHRWLGLSSWISRRLLTANPMVWSLPSSHASGLSLDACEFLSSYFCNRFQRVKVKNSRSEWAAIRKGITQGSTLGPSLFNVFVNDMFKKCDLYDYVDKSLSVASSHLHDVLSYLSRDGKKALNGSGTMECTQIHPSSSLCLCSYPTAGWMPVILSCKVMTTLY